MALINPQTTQISFERFQSITNSDGLFETWTDLINQESNTLPVNDEILTSLVRALNDVIGDNVVFENGSNKDLRIWNDALNTGNNKMDRDKWTMYLYQDYMLNLEIDYRDSKSAIAWSEYIAQNIDSQFKAKQDIQNALCVWEMYLLSIAIGNCRIVANAGGDANFLPDGTFNWTPWKNLGVVLTKIFLAQRRIRSKFSKGYKKEQTRFLTSQQLGLNLLAGVTGGVVSTQAYEDFLNKKQATIINGEAYEGTMYLGENFLMSEFSIGANQFNVGSSTGNLTQPFFLENLHGLIYFIESLKFYGHGQLLSEESLPMPNSRSKRVWTWAWRMNAAVLPIYARFNLSFVDSIPKFPAWTDTDGNLHAAKDLSKANDFNTFCNELRMKQPDLYGAFLDGASKITQAELDALWTKNTINWRA